MHNQHKHNQVIITDTVRFDEIQQRLLYFFNDFYKIFVDKIKIKHLFQRRWGIKNV